MVEDMNKSLAPLRRQIRRSRAFMLSLIARHEWPSFIACAIVVTVAFQFLNWRVSSWFLSGFVKSDSIVDDFKAIADKHNGYKLSDRQIAAILVYGRTPTWNGEDLEMKGRETYVPRPELGNRMLAAIKPAQPDEAIEEIAALVRPLTERLSEAWHYRWRRWTYGKVQHLTLFFFFLATFRLLYWRGSSRIEEGYLFKRDACLESRLPHARQHREWDRSMATSPGVVEGLREFLDDYRRDQIKVQVDRSRYLRRLLRIDDSPSILDEKANMICQMSNDQIHRFRNDLGKVGALEEGTRKLPIKLKEDLGKWFYDLKTNLPDIEFHKRASLAIDRVEAAIQDVDASGRLWCDELLRRLMYEYDLGPIGEESRLAVIDAGIEEIEQRFDVENHATRWLVAALPALGFIGTILGIGAGLSKADKPVEASGTSERVAAVQELTSSLAVAFDTTLVALVLSLLATLLMMLNERSRGAYVSNLRSLLIEAAPRSRQSSVHLDGRKNVVEHGELAGTQADPEAGR